MYLYMRSVICLRGSPFKYCCSTFVRLLLSTGERSWRIGALWWQKYSNMSYAHKHKGPPFLVFWLTFLHINEFKKRFWQRFEREMHEMNIIQTSCMHSIHYSKRSQKRFWTFWNCLSLFFLTLLAAIFPFTCFPCGKLYDENTLPKAAAKFFQHSFMVFAHTETLLTAIDGFIYAAF